MTSTLAVRLLDIPRIPFLQPKPVGYFSAHLYHVETLEHSDMIQSGGPYAEEAAHTAARNWSCTNYLGVVINHEGRAIAVYDCGKKIA